MTCFLKCINKVQLAEFPSAGLWICTRCGQKYSVMHDRDTGKFVEIKGNFLVGDNLELKILSEDTAGYKHAAAMARIRYNLPEEKISELRRMEFKNGEQIILLTDRWFDRGDLEDIFPHGVRFMY